MGENKDLYLEAIKQYGVRNQQIQVLEELSELMQSITKSCRGYDNRENVIEEMVDVHIMLQQLKCIYKVTDEELANLERFKIERLRIKLKKGGKVRR